jgi:murein DD-endopeptidase MepM/ murein hydrolase activator NlpD
MRLLPVAVPALLFVLFATLVNGCSVIGLGDDATPTPTQTPSPTPTATPSPTPTPLPELLTPALEVVQGGYAVVRVSAAAPGARAAFDGRQYPLLAEAGGFWGVIGVAGDQPPGAYPVEVALLDDLDRAVTTLDGTLTVYSGGYPVEEIYLAPEESALLDPALSAQEETIRDRVFSVFTPERLWSGPFIFPSTGPISSAYGIGRSYNGAPVLSFHHGTDFQADEGASVVAANAGRVAFAGPLPVRGNSVIIDHGGGVFSGYHHLSAFTVAEGRTVAAGDLIGRVGMTGLSTGPHLHWEIVVNKIAVDPVLWTYEAVGG